MRNVKSQKTPFWKISVLQHCVLFQAFNTGQEYIFKRDKLRYKSRLQSEQGAGEIIVPYCKALRHSHVKVEESTDIEHTVPDILNAERMRHLQLQQ